MLPPCLLGPIRTPLWNCCNDASFSVPYSDWWSRTELWMVAPVHSSIILHAFPTSSLRPWTQTKDKNESCVWVKLIILKADVQLRLGDRPQGRKGDTVLIISLLLSCTTVFIQIFTVHITLCFYITEQTEFDIVCVKSISKWHKISMLLNFLMLSRNTYTTPVNYRYF